jgi:adenylate cyclase
MAQRGIDFQTEGLLDGLREDQRAERLALLRHLESEGVPLREIRRRSQAGTLIFGTADRVLGADARLSAQEVSRLSGVNVEMLNAAHRAMGLPVPDSQEAEYTDADVESARMINVARAAGLSDEDLLELLRVLGRGLWGAAEALRELPMKLVLRPGMSERDLADAYARVVAELHPLLDPLMSNMLTLHLRHAAQSEVISEMERRGGDLPGSREVAVCFADLVGFTRIGEEVPPLELGRLAVRLEAIAADIAAAPVRLVKTIGDAAMLTSPEPQALLDSALALIAAADAEGEDFPQLRAGAALGTALPRAGDWYGRPVNIASRVTAIARPGSLLAERALHDAARDSYRWSFAGERRLRGIRDAVPLFRARALAHDPPAQVPL